MGVKELSNGRIRMSVSTKYRLVTRSDFDGLVCAMLFKELDMIDDILFVHPKDMQDGKVAVQPGDITTNLPYVEGCHLAFDHHESETLRLGASPLANHIIDPAGTVRGAGGVSLLRWRSNVSPCFARHHGRG